MTFNFLGPGLTVNVEAKVKEQIILDSSGVLCMIVHEELLLISFDQAQRAILIKKSNRTLINF